jgi:hypothetical protein
MVANDQNTNGIVDNAEHEMIGKLFEIHAPQVALANVISCGRIGGFLKKGP